MIIGFSYVLAAGILQGIFLLPMDYVRGWRWEHSWLAFSLFGMLAFNWIFALATLPHIFEIYRTAVPIDVGWLVLFGFGWGLGAVLFGLGMARLGLALGYPIIMGLIASLGALIPLLVFFPRMLVTTKGLLIAAGMLVVVAGIVVCSRAASQRGAVTASSADRLAGGILIAVAAGSLSCLPNIGMTFGTALVKSAQTYGAPASMAGNVVWALFFTAGATINAGYCVYLMFRNRAVRSPDAAQLPRNLALTALMGLLWIGSFYGYGAGVARLGVLGPVVGWPLFIATSIAIGNLVGLWRGEWRSAPPVARSHLDRGLIVLFVAVALIGASGFIQ